MTAAQIITHLSAVRPRGTDRWTARCPAHEDNSPSLTIRHASDRVLIHCWAGCAPQDVCSAVGLRLADLFNDHYKKPDPIVLRRRRAAESLESWRQSELLRIAEALRLRDILIGYVDHRVNAGLLTEEEAIIPLAYEYLGYSELERRFERLVRNQDTLHLWRESREAA